MTQKRYGLVEAGGTKFVLGVATGENAVEASTRIETTTPTETIGAMLDWFAVQGALDAVGVASFGPLELDRASPHWGCIGTTPKPHWSGADLAGSLQRALGCPVAIDTDVNGAALAEYHWGAGQGQKTMLYFTIGTGVGGGAIVDGRILCGLSHPEMGHFRPARHPEDPAHSIIAFYLAQTAVTMQSIFAPGRIIFGGGVMGTAGLLQKVRDAAVTLGNGYFRGNPQDVICLPGLGDRAGLLGALALAQNI
jgi:fructokinase